MDKKILIQSADMQQEVKDISRRIAEIERRLGSMKGEIVSDTVKGTRKDGTIGPIRITGFPEANYQQQKSSLEKLRRKLKQTEEELLEAMTQTEELIEGIESSELRIMFRLYYMDGLTWVQTAHAMNSMFRKKHYTEDGCRMKNARFFKEL